ncbi:MAG TPA: ABC transporter ATP-binding protein [Bryobacteraceae bacterium]|nr:ABC transporter ATP-binding protein [Bryobacteraceae bacterium]
MTACPLIQVRGLHYSYEDGTAALQGVDFRLDPGESVALLGPNGSGKTTFILHLNGLLAGKGAIEICGMKPDKANLPAIRRKVGVIFQDSDSQLFMPTVLEDVSFGPRNLGLEPKAAAGRALAALEAVGIAELRNRAPYHLSAGEKKRAAIAGVLAMEPEILVLDEPTTFLDPPAQRSLAALLSRLPQSKLVVTHTVAFAEAVCTRAVFFERGRIVAEGGVTEIAARFGWAFE